MMWNCYLTIFKAESSIHIGHKQIGMLKTTRYYIPGRAMWGAITANLTRALYPNPTSEDYRTIGVFVKKFIRTSYFYPAIKESDVDRSSDWSNCKVKGFLVLSPKYTDKGLKLGNITKEEFERIFIGSYISTGLESQTRSVEEGSLHEFEYIKNKIRVDGNANNSKVIDVYWVGYVFVRECDDAESNVKIITESDDVKLERNGVTKNLSEVLNTLFVGGERNYGFGKLKKCTFKPSDKDIFGFVELELDKDNPVVKPTTNGKSVVLAHTLVENQNNYTGENDYTGEIEPLVGKEWSESGVGMKTSKGFVCFTPGTEIERISSYTLGEFGIWKVHTP